MGNFLYWLFGLDSGGGSKYLFWSGAGSDITELTLLIGLVAFLRKHNCETKGCKRFGRHQWTNPQTGLSHTLCRRHHPHGDLTTDTIKRYRNGL